MIFALFDELTSVSTGTWLVEYALIEFSVTAILYSSVIFLPRYFVAQIVWYRCERRSNLVVVQETETELGRVRAWARPVIAMLGECKGEFHTARTQLLLTNYQANLQQHNISER